jgi:hypothetical protein
LPLDKLHDEKNRVSLLDDVMEHDDIRVVETRHRLGLTGNGVVTGAGFFHRDPTAKDRVKGEINYTRSARSKLAV